MAGKKEKDLKLTPATKGYWKSLQSELDNFGDVLSIEQKLFHRNLHYFGVVNCVAKHMKLGYVCGSILSQVSQFEVE